MVMAIPVLLRMRIRARSETWAGRLEKVVKTLAVAFALAAGRLRP